MNLQAASAQTAATEPQTDIKRLQDEAFICGDFRTVFGEDLTRRPAWRDFADSWNNLEIDRFMNDGGKYRYRRFDRYEYDHDKDELTLQPHAPYYQPVEDNPLNGGIERDFAPLEETTKENEVFRAILKTLGRNYSRMFGNGHWKINVYQNRILAAGGTAGDPAPEGPHKDGVRHSMVLLINRHNVEGGANVVYDNDRNFLFRHTLEQPGDCLLFHDRKIYHDALPVTAVDRDETGYRDALVVEFH